MGSDFQLRTPPPSPPGKKKELALEKVIEVTHLRKSGRGRGSGLIIILPHLYLPTLLCISDEAPRLIPSTIRIPGLIIGQRIF